MSKRRQGILKHVGCVGGADHDYCAEVSEFHLLRQELGRRKNHCSAGQNVSDSSPDLFLCASVRNRMCGHVEEEEVLLLGTEDALVDKAFAKTFTHLF